MTNNTNGQDVPVQKQNKTKATGKIELAGLFQSLLRWIDYNILPILAWPILLGLSAVGIFTLLGNLNHDWKIGIAIAIAAFVGFKAHK